MLNSKNIVLYLSAGIIALNSFGYNKERYISVLEGQIENDKVVLVKDLKDSGLFDRSDALHLIVTKSDGRVIKYSNTKELYCVKVSVNGEKKFILEEMN